MFTHKIIVALFPMRCKSLLFVLLGLGIYLSTFAYGAVAHAEMAHYSARNQTIPPTERREYINQRLRASKPVTDYQRDAVQDAPAGIFTINAQLTNIGQESIRDVALEVAKLSEHAQLLNADGGPGGVDAILSLPAEALGTDRLLTPGETITMTLEIGLQSKKAFDLEVNALGTVLYPSGTEPIDNGEELEKPVTPIEIDDGNTGDDSGGDDSGGDDSGNDDSGGDTGDNGSSDGESGGDEGNDGEGDTDASDGSTSDGDAPDNGSSDDTTGDESDSSGGDADGNDPEREGDDGSTATEHQIYLPTVSR